MATALTKKVLEDDLAVSLARVMASANARVRELGVNEKDCLITITQGENGGTNWRVNYGPKNCRNRRGGDVIVDVEGASGNVTGVLRGQ